MPVYWKPGDTAYWEKRILGAREQINKAQAIIKQARKNIWSYQKSMRTSRSASVTDFPVVSHVCDAAPGFKFYLVAFSKNRITIADKSGNTWSAMRRSGRCANSGMQLVDLQAIEPAIKHLSQNYVQLVV